MFDLLIVNSQNLVADFISCCILHRVTREYVIGLSYKKSRHVLIVPEFASFISKLRYLLIHRGKSITNDIYYKCS